MPQVAAPAELASFRTFVPPTTVRPAPPAGARSGRRTANWLCFFKTISVSNSSQLSSSKALILRLAGTEIGLVQDRVTVLGGWHRQGRRPWRWSCVARPSWPCSFASRASGPRNCGQDARDTQGRDALATRGAIAKLRWTMPPRAQGTSQECYPGMRGIEPGPFTFAVFLRNYLSETGLSAFVASACGARTCGGLAGVPGEQNGADLRRVGPVDTTAKFST